MKLVMLYFYTDINFKFHIEVIRSKMINKNKNLNILKILITFIISSFNDKLLINFRKIYCSQLSMKILHNKFFPESILKIRKNLETA